MGQCCSTGFNRGQQKNGKTRMSSAPLTVSPSINSYTTKYNMAAHNLLGTVTVSVFHYKESYLISRAIWFVSHGLCAYVSEVW